MSHRDKDCRRNARTSTQELLAVIKRLLAGIDCKDVGFRKDCQWTPFGLVAVALVWAWSTKGTLIERFDQAHKVVRGWGQDLAPLKTSYQAYMKMLVRWTVLLLGCLFCVLHVVMEREFPSEFRFAGFVILAGDGSKLKLARTRSNEARFSPTQYSSSTRGKKGKRRRKADHAKARNKKRPRSAEARAQHAKNKKSDCPQMALTLLYHVLLRMPWSWQLGPSGSSERDHLTQMIPSLPPDALIVADCGFFGYDFWTGIINSGRHFVIRVGGNVRLLRKLGVVRERNGVVYFWPNSAAKKKQAPLVLRLVVVHDGRQCWHLVTSVRDPNRLSEKQVAQIYRMRWRIELFFRHFKQTYRREKLRSHKAEHAECEAHWSLAGLWTMLLHTQIEQKRQMGEVKQVSVAKMCRAFGKAIDEHRSVVEKGESLSARLLAALPDGYRRRDRTSRAHPRKKYEPPTKSPHITKATRSQRKLAQQVVRRTTN